MNPTSPAPGEPQTATAPDPGTESAVSVRGVVKRFNGRTILAGVDLEIVRGRTTVIMGGSGSGKSTLLKHLIGILKPDEGDILYSGESIARCSEAQMAERRKRMGMLFQGAALFNSLSVGENVAFPLREHTRLPDSVIRTVVKLKLQQVGLRGFEDLRPAELSGGMKKRVGLARAIAMDPEIVYYDEPSAGLDPIATAAVDHLINELTRKLGFTSVVVTHDMTSAFRIADYMAMLHKGRIVAYGSPEQIRHHPEAVVQQFVTGSADGFIPMEAAREEFLRDLLSP